jgi:hypothetical protein
MIINPVGRDYAETAGYVQRGRRFARDDKGQGLERNAVVGFPRMLSVERTLLGSIPATNRRVPHISLVFREMWDTQDSPSSPLRAGGFTAASGEREAIMDDS